MSVQWKLSCSTQMDGPTDRWTDMIEPLLAALQMRLTRDIAMPSAGFEPTIPKWLRTYALLCLAIVISDDSNYTFLN